MHHELVTCFIQRNELKTSLKKQKRDTNLNMVDRELEIGHILVQDVKYISGFPPICLTVSIYFFLLAQFSFDFFFFIKTLLKRLLSN